MTASSRDRQMAVYAITTVFNDYPTMPEVIHRWTSSGAAMLSHHIRVKGGKRWHYAPQLAEVFSAHRDRERKLEQALGQLAILLECGSSTDDLRRFIRDALKR